jgi:hypothetical protein
MSFLVLRAFMSLIRFDLFLSRGSFSALHRRVRTCPMGGPANVSDATRTICAAVDVACIWYWKEVLCLQRSAATACLLKRYGIPAHMVIGAQQMPFRAHAWVEVDGFVVNDKPYMREMYAVLDRC